MRFRFIYLTSPILLANALVPQQIAFNSYINFTAHGVSNHVQDLNSLLGTANGHLAHNAPVLKTRTTTVYRPRSLVILRSTRAHSMHLEECSVEPLEWDVREVPGPDIEDRHTLTQLARMSGNAYALPGRHNWYVLDQSWNQSFPFGWDEEDDGFRGQVFLSADNSTIVLSIKGTTLSGPTSRKDRFNDNLLFSCCCGHVNPPWLIHSVCKCYASRYKCDSTCLSKALIDDSLFYSIGVKLVDDLIMEFPDANIWLTGHSLGGSLASLLGATYGFPAVTFESPGERVAAGRLHIPLPPSPPLEHLYSVSSNKTPDHPAYPHLPITHVYHTSDPIPQGACTGIFSPCAHAGYALETRCHLGQSIVFDTVGKLGWGVDVRTHTIKAVITRLLEDEEVDWGETEEGGDGDSNEDGSWWTRTNRSIQLMWKRTLDTFGLREIRKRRDVPKASVEEDCVDCFKWEFGDFDLPDDDGGDDGDDDDIPEPREPGWIG